MRKTTKNFIIKKWNELTEQEKETQTKKYFELICNDWGDMLYDDFKMELNEIKNNLKYIDFDFVYADDNSQGFWIDSIKDFKINIENKKNYIDDIEFTIHKYIEDINFLRINGTWEKIEDFENKNGFKKLIKEIKKDFEIFQNGINNAVKNYYYNIYDINSDFIESYFEDMEFEFEE